MERETICPCGSGHRYTICCQPRINTHSLVKTAVQLMRSRYTAFVLQKDQYIQASWHKSTRPTNSHFSDQPVTWLGLEIHGSRQGSIGDSHGTVDFSCRFLENNQLCTLREESQFIMENGLWYYLEGANNITKVSITRSSPCPCGSGRKFKRCCFAT